MSQTALLRNVAVVEHLSSTVISKLKPLSAQFAEESLVTVTYNSVILHNRNEEVYYINVLDTTTDYSLKIVDSVILVLDCTREPPMTIRKSMQKIDNELIDSVLVIDNIDEILHYSADRFYNQLNSILERTMQSYIARELTISPSDGSVCFGSSKHGWAFTVPQVAKLLTNKYNTEEKELCERLWGENYYNSDTNNWSKTRECNTKRGFDIVYNLLRSILEDEQIAKQFGVSITEEEQQKSPLERFHIVMKNLFPIEQTILDTIVQHVPSPIESQKRYKKLYAGPDDNFAHAIQNCDPAGPVMFCVAKHTNHEDKHVFFGRLFSGSLHAENIHLVTHENKFKKLVSPKFMIPSGKQWQEVDSPVPGQFLCIVATTDVPIEISDPITITDAGSGLFHGFRPFKRHCVVSVTMFPLDTSSGNLQRLEQKARNICYGTQVQFVTNGGYFFHAETHEELHHFMLEYLQVVDDSVYFSEITIKYRETVLGPQKDVALTKSPNRHNRLYMVCEPLSPDVIESIANKEDLSAKWKQERKRLWKYDEENCNVIVYSEIACCNVINEIKDSVCSAFRWSTKEGVLMEEPMFGIQFTIVDFSANSDAIHRGGGQIIPTARRNMFACELMAEPRIMQPIMHYTALLQEHCIGELMGLISSNNGVLLESTPSRIQEYTVVVRFYLSALHHGRLEKFNTLYGGSIDFSASFDHWQVMDGSPFSDQKIIDIITQVRTEKGMRPEIQPLTTYLDRL
jgi:elongation factor 2